MKPSSISRLSPLVSLINQGFAAEFTSLQPFIETPLPNEVSTIFVVKQYERQDQNQVSYQAEVRLVKGYQSFSAMADDTIELAPWLEHAFTQVKESLVAQPGFIGFYLGSYNEMMLPYPASINIVPTSNIQNTTQKSPWQVTLMAPCTLVVNVDQCF